MNFDYIFKCVVIGDSGTGKSSLCEAFFNDQLNSLNRPTIGADYFTKIIPIQKHYIKVQFWDTCGNELYHSVARSYYQGSHMVLLVYDISSGKSFENIKKWLADIRYSCDSDVVVMLVGNKYDLSLQTRQVSYHEGKEFADSNHFLFYETSAKTGIHVKEMIMSVIETCYLKFVQYMSVYTKVSVPLSPPTKSKVINPSTDNNKDTLTLCNCLLM